MVFDGCYYDSEIDVDQIFFFLYLEEDFMSIKFIGSFCVDLFQIKRKFLGGNVGRIILENNYIIDIYFRIVFFIIYIIFNLFYWGIYV